MCKYHKNCVSLKSVMWCEIQQAIRHKDNLESDNRDAVWLPKRQMPTKA